MAVPHIKAGIASLAASGSVLNAVRDIFRRWGIHVVRHALRMPGKSVLSSQMGDEMKTFKVGDRVAVYDLSRQVGTVESVKYESTNKAGEKFPMVGIRVSGGTKYAHPKQCRRLKPKRVAREFWIIPTAISSASLSHPVVLSFRPDNAGSYVHVIEKLPKKEIK